MLTQGVFPTSLKLARVTVLHKSGPKNVLGNYRPISVLSVFSKTFELILCNRLKLFFDKHKILCDEQFGFRKGLSTEIALLDAKEKIIQCMDQGHYVLGLFFDIRKAFDSLNHSVLLAKLEHYGIRENFLNVLSSYLSHRRQYVRIGTFTSEPLMTTHGVPQGSNLGPDMFLAYINDFVRISTHSRFVMFADDTNAFMSGPNLDMLEQSANTLCVSVLDWCTRNGLQLNEAKSKAIIFRTVNKPVKTLHIELNGAQIQTVDNLQFLGVTFDSH